MAQTFLMKNAKQSMGDFYFSGSQSVVKGQAVIWQSTDLFAFRVTEDCMMSTNATPFVKCKQGETFIIRHRTPEDEKLKNQVGIYIFDRDTTISLAYGQSEVEPIIINNENYNDFHADVKNYIDNQNSIMNKINVDALAVVTCNASANKDHLVVGQSVILTGYYTLKQGYTKVKEEWHYNKSLLSSSHSFTYKPTHDGSYTLYYTVTAHDTHGNTHVGQALVKISVRDQKPPIAKIQMVGSMFKDEEILLSGHQSTAKDGHIVSWEWSSASYGHFGSGKDIREVFHTEGVNYITLKVTDSNGHTAEATKQLIVKAKSHGSGGSSSKPSKTLRDTSQAMGSVTHIGLEIFEISVPTSMGMSDVAISVSAGFIANEWKSHYIPTSGHLTVYKNGNKVADKYIDTSMHRGGARGDSPHLVTLNKHIKTSVSAGDRWVVKMSYPVDSGRGDYLTYHSAVGGSQNGTFQLVIKPN